MRLAKKHTVTQPNVRGEDVFCLWGPYLPSAAPYETILSNSCVPDTYSRSTFVYRVVPGVKEQATVPYWFTINARDEHRA